MTSWQSITLGMMWGTAAGGLFWHFSRMARQITYVTLADGRQQRRSLPILIRLHLPLTPNLTRFLDKPMFEKTSTRLQARLVSAGMEGALSAKDIMALRALLPIVCGSVWWLFIRSAAASSPESIVDRSEWLLVALGLLWLTVYPDLWIKRCIQQRHRSIQRALPFVLDLLTLSVEAGMDFMTAMQRNIRRRPIDALNEELIRLLREIQLGKTRGQSLRALSLRVGLADLRSVCNALIQADELGVSIGSILRIQSDQMRQRRFERAEKLANEAPVKMLFPLMAFIFPAVFLILLGPIINRLIQEGL